MKRKSSNPEREAAKDAQHPKPYLQIREDLRRQIISGKLKPGDRISSENELARIYGVTPLTVRHGQKILLQEGLIRKERGSGTYVSDRAHEHHRIRLVCGLNPLRDASVAEMVSAYYLDSIRFCGQAARQYGLVLETVWMADHPAETRHEAVYRTGGPFSGYIFLGFPDPHPVVSAAREAGIHHVRLGRTAAAERVVWFDLAEAGRLAWESVRDSLFERQLGLVVMAMQGEQAGVQALVADIPGSIHQLQVPNHFSIRDIERYSYGYIRFLCMEGGRNPMGVVFLDEVLAHGGTRALLEAGLGEGQCPVVVVSGKSEMMQYGLPVTYVTHDTKAEAHWAVEMLLAQIEGRDGGIEPRRSPFRIEQLPELNPEDWMEELGVGGRGMVSG